MNKLVSLINAAVERNRDNEFRFYLAQVLTDREVSGTYGYLMPPGRTTSFDPVNLCVAVVVINDKSANGELTDSFGTYDASAQTETPAQASNTVVDSPTVYPFVRLQAGGVANGPFQVPAQGSQVYIAVSNWADPFVVQYSDVFLTSNTLRTYDKLNSTFVASNPVDYFKVVTNNDSTGSPVGGSVETMTANGFAYAASDRLTVSGGSYALSTNVNIPADATHSDFDQSKDGFFLAVNKSEGSVNMNGFLTAFKTVTDNINNQLGSLNAQIQNLVTILGTPVLYGVPTSGYSTPPVYTSLAPITDALTTIADNISEITDELDTGSTSIAASIDALFLTSAPAI